MLYPQYFIDDLKNRADIVRKLATLGLLMVLAFDGFSQDKLKPEQVDGFARATNDDLLARVDNLWSQLADGASGVVILRGSTTTNYLNKRRIEGCNIMRRYPADGLTFVFENQSKEYALEFWKIPKGVAAGSQFSPTDLDYKLTELRRPLELTTSIATDEFCPRHFDLEWFSKFMVANPMFLGKVVIDTSRRDFLKRIGKYRKELAALGVKALRVRFFRHHFYHESDEQWWLIPQTRK